jgi:hypothetical protein
MAASLVFDEKPQRLCLLEQMYLVTEEALRRWLPSTSLQTSQKTRQFLDTNQRNYRELDTILWILKTSTILRPMIVELCEHK